MRPLRINKSISSRISTMTAVFLVLSIVFSSVICGLIFSKLITDEISNSALNQLRGVGNNINVVMENCETISQSAVRSVSNRIQTSTATNESLQEILDNVTSVPFISHCGLCLDSSRFVGTGIDAPSVFDGEYMYVAGHQYGLQDAPEKFNQLCTGDWGIWNHDANKNVQDTIGTASYVCSVTDTNNDLWGILVMQVSHQQIYHIIEQSRFSVNSFNELCNKNGLMLMSTGSNNVKGVCVMEHLEEMGFADARESAKVILTCHRGVINCSVNRQKGMYCFAEIPHSNWIVSTFIPYTDIIGVDDVLRFLFLLLGLISIIFLAIFFTRSFVKRNLIPLNDLNDAADHLAKQDFSYPLPELSHDDDEVATLTRSFNKMRVDLLTTIEREKIEIQEHERINKEVEVARNIQMGMLPRYKKGHPFADHHDFYAYMRPALEVGGDLYHYHYDEDSFLFSIGDVSGKGVPSAILMSQIMSQLRHIALSDEKEFLGNMGLINRVACVDNAIDMFTTMSMARLELFTGQLSIVNAGHESPIAIGPDGIPHVLRVESNLPLGIVEDQEYSKQSFTIEPGTMLFFYTDGVTEAVDGEGRLYGKDRLLTVLKDANKVRPHQVVKRVQFDIDHFVGETPQGDDITMFAVFYKG